jgi:hypothetical protein
MSESQNSPITRPGNMADRQSDSEDLSMKSAHSDKEEDNDSSQEKLHSHIQSDSYFSGISIIELAPTITQTLTPSSEGPLILP